MFFILRILFIFVFSFSLCSIAEPIQLTDNDVDDTQPSISGKQVTWKQGTSVIYYDGTSFKNLGNCENSGPSPKVFNGRVVWLRPAAVNKPEVMYYDGDTTKQLSSNTDSGFSVSYLEIGPDIVTWTTYKNKDHRLWIYMNDSITFLKDSVGFENPSVSNKKIVWAAYDGNDREIRIFSNDTVNQITNNETDDIRPIVNNDTIVWTHFDGEDYEICLHNGQNIVNITDNNFNDEDPHCSMGTVAWVGCPPQNVGNVFLLKGGMPVCISTNSVEGWYPRACKERVVWIENRGIESEIMLWDKGSSSQITNNAFQEGQPCISESAMVWMEHDGNDWELFMLEFSGTGTIVSKQHFLQNFREKQYSLRVRMHPLNHLEVSGNVYNLHGQCLFRPNVTTCTRKRNLLPPYSSGVFILSTE